jgi:hypothetical protein
MIRRKRWLYLGGACTLLLCAAIGVNLHSSLRPAAQAEANLLPSADSVKSPPELTLARSEREFLWQVEHHGNVLNRYRFRALADALRRADAAALTALLSADFTGWAPRQSREVRLETDFAKVVRQEAADGPSLPLDRGAFVAYLLSFRRLFAQPPQLKLALMALGVARFSASFRRFPQLSSLISALILLLPEQRQLAPIRPFRRHDSPRSPGQQREPTVSVAAWTDSGELH